MLSKRSTKVAILILAIIGVLYISGYRFTGEQAARAFFTVDKNSKYMTEVDYDWGTVYLFDTPEGPRTVIAEKKSFLWVARTGFHLEKSEDGIQTMGWAIDERCTVIALKVIDPDVSFIDAGDGNFRKRMHINGEEMIIFSWTAAVDWQRLNGIAYSGDGEILYEYRYPHSNVIHMKDLKWHPYEGDALESEN